MLQFFYESGESLQYFVELPVRFLDVIG